MTNIEDTFDNQIHGTAIAQSHSISQGGRSTPVEYEEIVVSKLIDCEDPEFPQWLSFKLSGFAGEFRTHYTTTFQMPIDVLERTLQIFLEGEHGAADQDTIGQMIWRLAKYRTQLADASAEACA